MHLVLSEWFNAAYSVVPLCLWATTGRHSRLNRLRRWCRELCWFWSPSQRLRRVAGYNVKTLHNHGGFWYRHRDQQSRRNIVQSKLQRQLP